MKKRPAAAVADSSGDHKAKAVRSCKAKAKGSSKPKLAAPPKAQGSSKPKAEEPINSIIKEMLGKLTDSQRSTIMANLKQAEVFRMSSMCSGSDVAFAVATVLHKLLGAAPPEVCFSCEKVQWKQD